MVTTFARVYASWLKAQALTPEEGAIRLGISRSVSYEYINGQSMPTGTKIPLVAGILGVNAKRLKTAIAKDRAAQRAVKKGA